MDLPAQRGPEDFDQFPSCLSGLFVGGGNVHAGRNISISIPSTRTRIIRLLGDSLLLLFLNDHLDTLHYLRSDVSGIGFQDTGNALSSLLLLLVCHPKRE
jgi:hypothetical protein